MLDIKIINGTIIDGTGAPRYKADLGIKGDKIVKIGDLKHDAADKTIDAKNKYISPGFIDLHSHSDMSILHDRFSRSRIYSGVTTEVIGNCGIGVAPVNEDKKDLLLNYIQTRIVGTIPAPLEFNWKTYGEYLDFVDNIKPAVNIAPLLAHGAVRIHEMGFSEDDADENQLKNMKKEVHKAMSDGALGLTTGLIYLPGAFTGKEEIFELCKEIKQFGGYYCTHMRNEGNKIFEAIDEAIYIAKTAGVPLHISHLKLFGLDNANQTDKIFKVLEEAECSGLKVTWDCYPYTSGMSSLSAMCPPWVFEGGVGKLVERIKSKDIRKQVIKDIETGVEDWQNPMKSSKGAENVVIASLMLEKNKWYEGKSLEEIGEIQNKDPYDVMFDTLIEENAKVQVITKMMDEEDVKNIVAHPKTMFGSDSMGVSAEGLLSFGKPHPRSFGTFGRIFGYYVKELGVLSFEEAVKKMTSMPAELLRLKNRGILKEDYYADIVVFDPDEITDKATYSDPKQYTAGIEHVLVNGETALNNGIQTETTAGRVLRNSKSLFSI